MPVQLSESDRRQLQLGMEGAFSRVARLNDFLEDDLHLDAEDYTRGVEKHEAIRKLVKEYNGEGRIDELLDKLRTSDFRDAASLKPVLARLASAAETAQEPWEEDDPFRSYFLPPENRPFIGRDGLRKHLRAIARGRGKRVIVISGERPCGKSWSWWFLSYVAGRCGEFLTTKLDLADYPKPPSPLELMTDLARELGLDDPPENTVAKPSTQSRQLAAWFKGRLRQTDEHVVVAVDSLDHRRLPNDTEDLIRRLARLAAESGAEVGFTLMLLGPKFELYTVDRFSLGEETITALTKDDVRDFLTELGDARGKPLPSSEADKVIATAFDDPAEDPLEALRQVSDVVADFAGVYFKNAAGT